MKRAKEKIGFKKRESDFNNLKEDDSRPENYEKSAWGLIINQYKKRSVTMI